MSDTKTKKINCIKCKGSTNHKVVQTHVQQVYPWSTSDSYDYNDSSSYYEECHYQIMVCQGCDTVSYREYTVVYSGSDSQMKDEKFYPVIDINERQLKFTKTDIPKKIFNLYKEVIDTYNRKLKVLCSAGIRAIIEGICNDRGVNFGSVIEYDKKGVPKLDLDGVIKRKKSSNLDGKIEGLVELGLLLKPNANSLHELRFLGNEAVHQLEKPSEEELKLAIEIIENTLESIYVIKHKGEKLEGLKDKRKNTPLDDED
ncbi:MAG: DUF4145 domain-containing protein [Chitinophagales bacterium]|nr:DUF4145 domain-containing protein [Chitinophagales bacterium]